MHVYLASLHDDAPEAVFSTLEAAQAWAEPRALDVLGPYVVDEPNADLANWFDNPVVATFSPGGVVPPIGLIKRGRPE